MTWPRPAAVRELVTEPGRFRLFAEQVSGEVERALAAASVPAGDTRARLLSLRVHLSLYLGHDARALAAATQIRETITPPAERAFSGLLTEAMVVARAAALAERSDPPDGSPASPDASHPAPPATSVARFGKNGTVAEAPATLSGTPADPASPAFPPALRSALESRLATLPTTPELTAVLARQRERFATLTRDSLLAEADRLGARLDSTARWTLAEVDDVVRVGHRLATLLPLREELLAAFAAALAERPGSGPRVSAGARSRSPESGTFLILPSRPYP